MEVYPERQKRQKTWFVCNFNGKSVFRCAQRAITQRRIITLGPIFIKMVLNRAQGLKEKSQEVSVRKNNNRQRYNKKCWRGGFHPPPALLGLIVLHVSIYCTCIILSLSFPASSPLKSFWACSEHKLSLSVCSWLSVRHTLETNVS